MGAISRLPKFQLGLLLITAAAALASLVNTPYPELAPLQNLPTLGVLAAIAWSLCRFPMPTSAVTCVCLFLILHTIGGRYIYSFVPYDRWVEKLGLPTPTQVFGLHRNGWDRLVHFCFGLLMVHPISSWLMRHRAIGPALATYIAVEFVFAGSALYEIFEWLLTIIMAGPDADAYNGQQGDIWDAQKDMACAAVGAIVAAFIVRIRAATTASS